MDAIVYPSVKNRVAGTSGDLIFEILFFPISVHQRKSAVKLDFDFLCALCVLCGKGF
jgi:hypothetical protein